MAAFKCERCNKATAGYDLFDYCASCSRNLCDPCMADGCCGAKPAKSGMDADLTYGDGKPLTPQELDEGAADQDDRDERAARR